MLYPMPKNQQFSASLLPIPSLTVSGPCADLFAEAARIYGYSAVYAAEEKSTVRLQLDLILAGQEAYTLTVDDRVTLRGNSEGALARGIWTLLELLHEHDGTALPCGTVEDRAYNPLRGVHLYLPPLDCIEDCKRFFSVLARLKYNTIILEIGGGMEFERHPEVNRAFMKFCREAYRHPGGPQGLQASEPYWKDSTHVEVAGGAFLPKSAVRELCDYARLLRMEVIPEIPALSHAYYLTLADRSIAERPFEQWPDSYCPSNPRSYELYEDCAEEILEVIRPARVSIGHDEVRVLGECPICRKKSGAELLAKDLNTLHDFYAQKGIQICMWGEMLQNFENYKGVRAGGVGRPFVKDRYGRPYCLIETHEAIDRIPTDILMLDWYHAEGDETEAGFESRGIAEIYGNFHGSRLVNWDKRSRHTNLRGAEVSTWCIPNEDELGGNGWFYELAFSAAMLWQDDYDDSRRDAWAHRVEALLPSLRELETGKRSAFHGLSRECRRLILADGTANSKIRAFEAQTGIAPDLAQKLTENGLSHGDSFKIDAQTAALVLFHAAENPPAKRDYSWFFLNPAPRLPASYAVDYEDGLTIRIPVYFPFGTGLWDSNPGFYRPQSDALQAAEIDDDRKSRVSRPAPVVAPYDIWRAPAVYFNRAAAIDTSEGERTVYAMEWTNPRPDMAIRTVRVVNEEASAMTLRCFGVGVL